VRRVGLWRWAARLRENASLREATNRLVEQANLERRFLVMSVLSGMMATLGTLMNDTVVLIAAMVLAPILNPILAMAAGIVLWHGRLIFYALKSLFVGILGVVIFSAILVKLIKFIGYEVNINPFLSQFSDDILLGSFVAAISGFAAVYSWLRPIATSQMVGVAIAVSLIPVISFFGILLGSEKFGIFEWLQTLIFFSMNLASIVVGAIIAFVWCGFLRSNGHKKEVDRELEVLERRIV